MLDAVVHPLAFTPGTHNARLSQIRQMPGNLWLALLENFNEVAHADFAPGHEVQKTQARRVCKSGEELNQVKRFGASGHAVIIYALTDMFHAPYICFNECEVSMDTKTLVQEKYGAAARSVRDSGAMACCNTGLSCCDPITKDLYRDAEKGALPENAVLASLGCGNPTALIDLKPGEVVLDLGSGGGIDVLLSANRVGPTGKAYGLDMTDDMLALARNNQRQAGVENVEFLKGEIESIPLPDNTVDVVISNCVINLSADKDRVLREAFRVLKPGGRFAVSDVVVRGEVHDEVRKSMLLWVGCIAGALEESEYQAKLAIAGFKDISLEPTRIYNIEDARHFLTEAGINVDAITSQVDGKFMSAFVRATKPAACCAPGCCN
jgi:arsenite methyltransferase